VADSDPPQTDDADPLIGRVVVDRFELLELIGQGGFGAVYRALQSPVGREVAVKVMAQEHALNFVCDVANLADRKHRQNHCATLLLRAGDAIEKDEPARAQKLTCRGSETFLTEIPGQSAQLGAKRKAQKSHYAARCRKLTRDLPDGGPPEP
jgi:hypothetical protein